MLNNKLTINVGPMFSGKTTALQQQGKKHIEAKHNIVFLKPLLDNRYSNTEIVSHDGIKVKSINITDSLLIHDVDRADVILIDEVQFMKPAIVDEIWDLLKKGKNIYCSGLDTDYLGKGFITTMHLLAIADKVNKFTAICKCGKDATFTSKKNYNGNTIELGASDLYFPSCRKCFINEIERNR